MPGRLGLFGIAHRQQGADAAFLAGAHGQGRGEEARLISDETGRGDAESR
ncbi:hypothetical protein SAMN02746000_03499 [Paracoccus sp. J56]|nr:hypothetical protein SAMN02746000_03499 [Paracoccus sp. J56]